MACRGVPSELALPVYRIVEEAVSNALRHGRPTTIAVRVRGAARSLHVSVEDDGVGVTAGTPEGTGLTLLRARAHVLGGTVELGGREGGGTRLQCALPLAAATLEAAADANDDVTAQGRGAGVDTGAPSTEPPPAISEFAPEAAQ